MVRRRRIDPSFIESLKQIDLYQFVKTYPSLQGGRVSGRNFFALCPSPQHADRQAKNFCVSHDKSLYHCFSCGFSGNSAISFIKEVEGFDFYDAVLRVADLVHRPVRYLSTLNDTASRENEGKVLIDHLEAVFDDPKITLPLSSAVSKHDHPLSPSAWKLLESENLCKAQGGSRYQWLGHYPVYDQQGSPVSLAMVTEDGVEVEVTGSIPQTGSLWWGHVAPRSLTPSVVRLWQPQDSVVLSASPRAVNSLIRQGDQACGVLRGDQTMESALFLVVDQLVQQGKQVILHLPDVSLLDSPGDFFSQLIRRQYHRLQKQEYLHPVDGTVLPPVLLNQDKNGSQSMRSMLLSSESIYEAYERKTGQTFALPQLLTHPQSVVSTANLLKDTHQSYYRLLGSLLASPDPQAGTMCREQLGTLKNFTQSQRNTLMSLCDFMVMGIGQREVLMSVLPPEDRQRAMKGRENDSVVDALASCRVDLIERPSEQQALLDLNQRAAQYYQQYLQAEGSGQIGRAYLQRRGISDEMARRFQLGFSPPHHRFAHELDQTLRDCAVDAGLLGKKDREGETGYYSVLRNRLIFPIQNDKGQFVGFGGRAVAQGRGPKYLNTKATAVYDKKQLLYGLHQCLVVDQRPARLLVVEGYLDVIPLHQAGLRQAVATCGTAMTSEHIQKIFQYTQQVVCVFDGDEAGQKAAKRAAFAALPYMSSEREMLFARLPEGDDPGSFIEREGREAFEQRLSQASPLYEFLQTALARHLDLQRIDHQLVYQQRLEKLVATIDPRFQAEGIAALAAPLQQPSLTSSSSRQTAAKEVRSLTSETSPVIGSL